MTGRYSNADHLEFHKLSHVIFDKNKDLINAPDLIDAYQAKVTQENYVFNWHRRSEFTKKKADTDYERDRTLQGIAGILHAYDKFFDPQLRDSAKHILNLINSYRHLTRNGYDSETADIDSILDRLNSTAYITAVQNLHLEPWLAHLEQMNRQFKNYAADTLREQIEKPKISTKAARPETDEAFRRITLRITSFININGPSAYTALIREFNINVSHYNTLIHERYGRLHAKTDITPGEIEYIDVQPSTGKPVYVIPSIKIREKETAVELIFSQDFTVRYRNNIKPGTATLIACGIGKYTGKIVTTFNIVAAETSNPQP